MSADRYAHLREFYKDFEHHSDEARRVAWRSKDDQAMRLEVLLEAVDDAHYPLSILDVGCGVGTLYGILKRSARLGQYVGIDLLPTMVQRARERFPEGDFREADLLGDAPRGPFDLVVCSGALNVVVDDHENWAQRMLKAMWERATLAVAVNFQTTRAYKYNPLARSDDDIYHAERAMLLAWCEALTPWIAMRQDYLGDDAAFYLYKQHHHTVMHMARRRTEADRKNPENACGLAYLLLERKLPLMALEVLKDARSTAWVLNYRGLCYHQLGNHRKARKHYEEALELDPDLEEARLNLDWIVERDGE